MRIDPDNKELQYSGRIDFADKKAPVFVFPCTSVKMRFTGKRLRIYLKNRKEYWDNYAGYILDGVQGKQKLQDQGETVIELAADPARQEHEILLFKRQDACHELTFLGFEIEDKAQVLTLPPKPERKIEVYGDSVSAGEVSEAVAYTGKEDPEHNGEYSNSWYSYAWMTARKLDAQLHDIAQGGIALLDDTGWFHAPDYIGMEQAWDKVHYNPSFGVQTKWEFSDYLPDVVIVAIGQNDNHPVDYMKEDSNCEKAVFWKENYEKFIRKLRKVYPNAWIILTTTILMHDYSWDKAIEEICQKIDDVKIRHFLYSRNGNGTPGHIRISEADEMSEELAAYISSLKIEGWDKRCTR